MSNDNELIGRFAADRSEEAFTELVARHLDLVYGAALRQTREPELARDVAQQVFAVLARKAPGLRGHVSLVGWLHRCTYLASKKALRTEARRRSREQTAAAMIELHQTPSNPEWDQVSPLLDDAVEQLNDADRTAILARFFERRPLAEVGTTLGISEDAARKRVSRAVEKLRDLLEQRGVKISTTSLAAALSGNLATSAPAGLVTAVSTQAIASVGGIGAFISQLSLTAKIAMGAGAVGVVAALLTLAGPTPEPETATTQPIPPESSRVEPTTSPTTAARVNGSDSQAQITAQRSTPEATEFEPTPMLRLTVLDKATGEPIPNAAVERLSFGKGDGGLNRHVEQTDSNGMCEFTWPEHDSEMIYVTSQIEGYADTRLTWRLDQGAEIPTEYTLAVEQAAPIGGWVADEEGNAVADATIGISHERLAENPSNPQSHAFQYITTTSDTNGRWRITRIAQDMLPLLQGSASHPAYVSASHHPQSPGAKSNELFPQDKFVFQLTNGITVTGSVADESGNPIRNAKIVAGIPGMNIRRETQSGENGFFRLIACDPRYTTISAEADDFAAKTLRFDNTDPEAHVEFQLRKGRTLSIRVYDREGLPVAGANVWHDTTLRAAILGVAQDPTPPTVSFAGKTDRFGEIIWQNAPSEPLAFDISRSGYIRANGVTISESATELVVDLKSALTIRGSVTDAQTGDRISQVTATAGSMMPAVPQLGRPARLFLSPNIEDRHEFKGSEFQITFEEPLISGWAENPGYYLSFAANGYEPFISRLFDEDEIDVELHVKLKPQTTQAIRILNTNGDSVQGAEAALAGPYGRVKLGDGGIAVDAADRSMVRLMQSDHGGVVHIGSDPMHTDIVIIHASGFAHVSLETAFSDGNINLHDWSALEGILTRNGNPVVGEQLAIRFSGEDFNSAVQFDRFQFTVHTDQAGRFSFPQLPPEPIELLTVGIDTTSPQGPRISWSPVPNGRIGLQPGETSTVELDLMAPFDAGPTTAR